MVNLRTKIVKFTHLRTAGTFMSTIPVVSTTSLCNFHKRAVFCSGFSVSINSDLTQLRRHRRATSS